MAANPIQPDPYLERAAAHLAELNGQLSAPEREFVAEANTRPWRPSGLPVAEMDCELKIPGQSALQLSVSVWGSFVDGGFEVDTVMIGEADITADIGEAGQDACAAYVMENC